MTNRERVERARLVIAGLLDAEPGESLGGLRLDRIAMLRNDVGPEYAAKLPELFLRYLIDGEREDGELNLTRVVFRYVHRVLELTLDYEEEEAARTPSARETALDNLLEELIPF